MAVWNLQKTIKVLGSGKDFDKAEAYINKSIKYMPYDIYYRTKSDISNAKIESILSSTITKENVESARNTFISELQKSIESSLKAKERDPKNYLNYIYMGNSYALAVPKSYRIKGAYESAVASYNQAMVLNPKNPAIPLLMARLEIDNENIKKAKEYINDAISKKNNYLDAYFLLSQIQISENNINEAIKSVETAVIINPTNPALFFQLGLLYYNTKNYNNAVLALQKSIEITPEYANARYFLGLSLSRLGEYKLALAHFEELLKTNPDSKDLMDIINDLSVNKSPFEDTKIDTKSKKLPVKENN
jgi:tetratricopeptide (TPR) repeat protein